MNRPSIRLRALAVLLGVAVVAVACGDDDETADDGAGTTATTVPDGGAAGGEGDGDGALSGVCPDTVVIQTDWNAEAEHGGAYQLVSDDYEIDTAASAVRGSLVAADGSDTGVDVEIRYGGPAIGFQTVTAQMYQDPDILLGFVNTDEAVANAADQPTISVMAPLEKNPQILMWNPEEFEGVETVDQMPEGTQVVAFGPATYLEWLVAEGIVTADQIDGSYDASPTRFVAENGAYLQQGFASAEPYIYLNEVEDYAKPVAYQLIHDMGFEQYSQALAVTPENLEANRDCLGALVPIYQAAQVAYVADPADTNALIVETVETIDNGWVYTPGVADYSVATQLELGIVGNGPDATLGNFDLDRVQTIIDEMVPILEDRGTPAPEGLTAEDIVTNEFVDPGIGLP